MPILSPSVLQTSNENTPLFSNLFSGGKGSFYDYFYNSFLTTPNSLPLNNLWIVFFNSIPSSIVENLQKYEGWGTAITKSHETAKKEGTREKSGLLIAQSVKIMGEKLDTSRVGSARMGSVKGIVGEGRASYQTFSVSMMENQLSFVDYVLRPWVIASANASLKDPAFKTDIIVWHLGKMGARRDMARRKIFIYKNCVPVAIDEQEYNYAGNDVLIKRSVEFAFSKYEMEASDDKFISLVENGYKDKGFLSGIVGGLQEDLQRALGANGFNDFVANTIDGLKTFAATTATTAIGNVGANTTGAVGDVVSDAVTGLGGEIRGGVNEGVSSVNDAVNETINNLTQSNNGSAPASFTNMNDDVPRHASPLTTQRSAQVVGAVIKNTNPEDTTGYKSLPNPIVMGKKEQIDTNKPISQFDTPSSLIAPPSKKTGDINADTVRFSDNIPYRSKQNPTNDSRVQYENVPYRTRRVDKNDYVSQGQGISYAQKQIDPNDVRTNRQAVRINDKKASDKDSVENGPINYTLKTVNPNDATDYRKNV